MGAEDLAFIEDAVLRMVQKKTGQRWSQQYHSLEAIKEALLGPHLYRPRTKTWYASSVDGNDVTGDGGENKPYATLGKTVTEAPAYDTIIGWGTFAENSIAPKIGHRLIGLGHGMSLLNKSVNTNPGIIVDNHAIELLGFLIDGGGFTGHGIRIIDSNNCHIHHNTIRNITGAYDGIDKSSGAVITGAKIHDNIIIDGAGAGIGMVNVTESDIDYNTCLRNIDQGIMLNATCDYLVLKENICNKNDVGIWLQGDHNHLIRNTTLGNVIVDLKDDGTNNQWDDNKFHRTTAGTHTTSGGIEETVLTETCVQPNTRLTGYLRLNNMIAGDDFTFRVKKSWDSGVTWDIIDETNLVGVQVIARYNYDLTLEAITEGARVTIQRNGAVDRGFYHKRTKGDR